MFFLSQNYKMRKLNFIGNSKFFKKKIYFFILWGRPIEKLKKN